MSYFIKLILIANILNDQISILHFTLLIYSSDFKERKLLIGAQKELGNLHKKLESFEAEISVLKEERDTIQLKLKEEKGRINILDQQKKSLQSSLDESKKKEVCSPYEKYLE